MHQFQRYDPAQPRTVTSFKGNQKLIFEGYRYNIHHIVPAKGVKTWRCVCAKKLTCSRSWCKGRAETWDGDSQGISKGEHNHAAEHEVAELEYFKSQLILAAIASPNANLNELIDEATAFMSEGVNFGSRESLKKSLTVARKAAENGGFKLKCYKSSDKPIKNLAYNKLVRHQHQTPTTAPTMTATMVAKRDEKAKATVGNGSGGKTAGTVLSLLSLAKQCQQSKASLDEKSAAAPIGRPPRTAVSSSCSPFSASTPSSLLLDSSGYHSANSSLSHSGSFSSPPQSENVAQNSLLFAAVAAAAAAFGNGNGLRKGGSSGTERAPASVWTPAATQSAHIVQRKKARVNSIFDRLSTKAAVAAATSSPPPPTAVASSMSTADSEAEKQPKEEAAIVGDEHEENSAKATESVGAAVATDAGTQTDEAEGFDSALAEWRMVRVCCCEHKRECTANSQPPRKARKRSCPAEEEEEAGEEREHSAPPSTSSSVENQPQHLGKKCEEEDPPMDQQAEDRLAEPL